MVLENPNLLFTRCGNVERVDNLMGPEVPFFVCVGVANHIQFLKRLWFIFRYFKSISLVVTAPKIGLAHIFPLFVVLLF